VSPPPQENEPPLTPRQAWQPFTPRGVAAFAHATASRLFLVQLFVAAVIAFALVLCLRATWLPVVREAIAHLPETGVIRRGELSLAGGPNQRLAGNAQLALSLALSEERDGGSAADLEIRFEKNRVALCGHLGCGWWTYDPRYIIAFNRLELEPWWGAWRGPLLGATALLTVAVLLVLWWMVGLLYLPLVKFIAFFTDRAVTWGGAWRVATAALLPGALLLAVGLLLYGAGLLDLFRFTLLYLLHIMAGLVFVVTSPLFLPKHFSQGKGGNPFDLSGSTRKTSSPFQKPGGD
jgi:hypothetical protein